MEQARINIIEPTGVRRSMPIPPQGLTIGRDTECAIVISYDRASRQHAQITFDGQNYYVTDLNSKNGTFLGKTQLAPNAPTLWEASVPLRIGDIYFNLELPNYYDRQREELGTEETLAGYIPEESQPKKNNTLKYLIGGAIALLLLCGCIGILGVAAYIFMNSAAFG
jgi:predicted component of type VI protein secretion system